MNGLRMVLLLARWEFMRYFRWKDLLISMAISIGLIVVIAVVGKLIIVAKDQAEVRQLAVVGEPPFALPASTDEFAWVDDAPATPAELDASIADGAVDGYVQFESDGRGTIVSESDGAWLDALRSALTDARRDDRVRAHGLGQAALDDILLDFELERLTVADAAEQRAGDAEVRKRPSRAAKVIAIAFVALMFIGVMTGTSYLFMGITSEKQSRVTEQIVAATPPQRWIDGKIVGAAARSSMALGLLTIQCILGIVAWLFFVESGSAMPPDLLDLGQIVVFGVVAVLGFALWFCVFAAIAATINDPNTSSRGVFLLLPFVAAGFAVPVYLDPLGRLALILGLVPITSPVALPMRMILGEIGWWEVPVAVLALIVSIWLMRRGAGKVFALGIMMHGKEPSWRDMWRAFRAG